MLKTEEISRDVSQNIMGQPELWDDNWKKMEGTQNEMVYTASPPGTLKELIQKAYFADLWHAMDRNVESVKYLELGSGRATTSLYLTAVGADVTLVDLSENALRIAVNNFSRQGFKEPTTLLADASQTGLADHSYDCIYNIGLLEHFEDPKPVIAESFRLLKPGGMIFMVIVPAVPKRRQWLSWLMFSPWRLLIYPSKQIVKKIIGYQSKKTDGVLRTEFNRHQYLAWAREVGFRDVDCFAYNPYFPIISQPCARERYYQLPLLRAHHALKKRLGRYPSLKTLPGISQCDLLIGRKDP